MVSRPDASVPPSSHDVAAVQQRHATSGLLFTVLCAGSVILGWRSLAYTFSLAWSNDQYTHILLILPVSAALIWLDWHSLQAKVHLNPRLGPSVMFAALLISWVAWRASLGPGVKLSLSMLAIVSWWIGAFLLCFGMAVSRMLLFPLCFLFWLIPFPNFLVDQIISLLQLGSAASARILFRAAGVPVIQTGLRLSIPSLTVEVAAECSSIRSSLMLLVTTMVLAQLLVRSSARKMFVIAAAVPLSVVKNGLRIFAIAMLGTRVDPIFLTGKFHHQGGIIFFLIALVLILTLLWIMRWAESPAKIAPSVSPPGM